LFLQVHFPILFQLFATGVIDTGGKFTAGVVDTGGNCHQYQRHPQYWWQICHLCCWYQWCILTWKYLSEFFSRIWNEPNVIFRSLGKMIHEKSLAKIFLHCPFNYIVIARFGKFICRNTKLNTLEQSCCGWDTKVNFSHIFKLKFQLSSFLGRESERIKLSKNSPLYNIVMNLVFMFNIFLIVIFQQNNIST